MYEVNIKAIAQARINFKTAKEKFNEYMEKIYSDDEYKNLSLEVTEAKEKLDMLTGELKAEVEGCFRSKIEECTPEDKHPHPAITIKEVTKVDIDEPKARKYCLENLKQALKLDTTKFKKFALALDESDRPDCISVRKEPQMNLKQDLSEYLDE